MNDKSNKSSLDLDKVKKIKNYLDKHYSDYGLSLTEIWILNLFNSILDCDNSYHAIETILDQYEKVSYARFMDFDLQSIKTHYIMNFPDEYVIYKLR